MLLFLLELVLLFLLGSLVPVYLLDLESLLGPVCPESRSALDLESQLLSALDLESRLLLALDLESRLLLALDLGSQLLLALDLGSLLLLALDLGSRLLLALDLGSRLLLALDLGSQLDLVLLSVPEPESHHIRIPVQYPYLSKELHILLPS